MRFAQASHVMTVLSLGVALVGCDPAADDVGLQSEALLGAPLDPGHQFAVGVCTGVINADGSCPLPGTPSTSRCSGTLVSPNLVLTARHCVERVGPQSDPADFCSAEFTGVRINASISVTAKDSVLQPGGTWYHVQRVDAPAGRRACDDDIALLQLGFNVQGVAIAGIDLHRNVAQDSPEEVAIVGRGWIRERYNPETFELVEFDNGGLLRRKLENIPFMCASEVDRVCSVVDYFSTPPIFHFSSGEFGYDPSGAPGDSGAGVYPQESFDDGLYWVVGVHSTGTMAADGNSSGGQAIRVDRHARFIRSVAERAALMGRYPLPWWATE